MRILTGICLSLVIPIAGICETPQPTAKSAKDIRRAMVPPKLGVKTPGVRIPFASLKPEAQVDVAAPWMAFTDAPLIPKSKEGLSKIDTKTNKLADAFAGLNKPCGGVVSAFSSLWVPDCGDQSLERLDPKTFKPTAKVVTGVGGAFPVIAATADSMWALSDNKVTLSRIDPKLNQVVDELRLPSSCNNLTFAENSLWLACPGENRVLRVNPATNLVEKRIEVASEPTMLVSGEGSIWVYCRKDGKIDRIDPKTNKVSKSIETEVPGVDGSIAIGQGSVWVTQAGFPITRIDPGTEKVVQQFYGDGGGAIYFGSNALWLANVKEGTVLRIDPKRVSATLAE